MLQLTGIDQALIGFLVSAAFLALMFCYAFYYLMKKERELREAQQTLDKRAAQTIERSHKKATDILAEAVDNAKQILADTKTFQAKMESDVTDAITADRAAFQTMLKDQLQKTVQTYNQILSEVAIFYKDSVKEAAAQLKNAQIRQEEDYRKLVQDESLTAKFYIQRRVNEELDKANKEIQDYKESELSHVRNKFDILIDEISERVFEGSLTPQQHEELIFRALEEAKKNRIFTT